MQQTKCVFISEAARIVGVSPQTLRAWEETGRLVPTRIAGVRVFDLAELERIAVERAGKRADAGADR